MTSMIELIAVIHVLSLRLCQLSFQVEILCLQFLLPDFKGKVLVVCSF